MKIKIPPIILAVLAIAVLFRMAFFFFGLVRLPLSSDEAWPALMGMHILKGEFPVFYWGQTYMGTQESFFDAALFYFFGPGKAVIRIYPLLFSFLFVFVSYFLACRAFNREVGLITLCLLAIPIPYLAMCGVAVPPDNYLAVITLGGAALWLTLNIVSRDKARMGDYLLLGVLLGYAFWMHLLVIGFIVCCLAWLFLHDKLLFIRRNFWIMAAAFLLAGLPFWWVNIKDGFATFDDVGHASDWQRTSGYLKIAVTYTVQFFTGQRIMLYADNCRNLVLPRALFYVLGGVWICLVLAAVFGNLSGLLRLFALKLGEKSGGALLIGAAILSVLVFAHSSRTGSDDARYLLPLMSALPILGAFGIWQIKKCFRPAGILVILFIMFCQLWGNVKLAGAWSDASLVAGPLELPDTRPLIAFLDQHGIRRAYAHYWLSYRITCETRERLIVSEPFNERFPGRPVHYLDEAARSEKIAFITHPTLYPPAGFEPSLRKIGGAWQKKQIDCFTVYYDFKPPCDDRFLKEIPTGACTAKDTGGGFAIDFGRPVELGKIKMRPSGDYPRELIVHASDDGAAWREIWRQDDFGLSWENGQPRYLYWDGCCNVVFPATRARYFRLNFAGGDANFRPAITDFHFYSSEVAE